MGRKRILGAQLEPPNPAVREPDILAHLRQVISKFPAAHTHLGQHRCHLRPKQSVLIYIQSG